MQNTKSTNWVFVVSRTGLTTMIMRRLATYRSYTPTPMTTDPSIG